MYHDIGVGFTRAAQIEIAGSTLAVSAGQWPSSGGEVAVPAANADLLDSDSFVYLDRQGGIVVSDEFIPYGQDAAGHDNEMLDLLAWKEGDGWNVKRLVEVGSA